MAAGLPKTGGTSPYASQVKRRAFLLMASRQIGWGVWWVALLLTWQGACGPTTGECASAQLSDRFSIQIGEFKRAYRLHLPPTYDGRLPAPLVLVFHGRSQGARDIAEIAGLNDLADQQGFIAAYPIGIRQHWNDGRAVTPIFGAGNYDDVGFVAALITHLEETLAIDPTRIYATGMSNGAMFVQRLACELDGVFAAIAPVAGTLPSDIAPRCTPKEPVSVIEFHGTKDAYILWHGGNVRALGGTTLSVPKTIAHWQQLNGCPSASRVAYEPHIDPAGSARVRREAYGPCHDGSEVVLYAIEGGGHTWPGGPPDDSLIFSGRVTRDISATEVMWAFFKQHQKPSRVATAIANQTVSVSQPPPDSRDSTRPTQQAPLTMFRLAIETALMDRSPQQKLENR